MQLRLWIAGLIILNAGPAYGAQVLVSINENSQQMTVSVDGQQEYVRDAHRAVINPSGWR